MKNDCALVLDDGKVRIAQTTLGFLFRKLVSDFDEETAENYFNWGYDNYKRNCGWLQEALGEEYATKYQAFFLPLVDPHQIYDVAELGRGSNGIVYSAKWKGGQSEYLGDEDSISVVLKQPLHTNKEHNWQEKFIEEVPLSCCFYNARR